MMILKPNKTMSGVSKLKHQRRLYQLGKVDILLKLMDSKRVDVQEALRLNYNSPSFKFYESCDILLHKKVGDTR
jgi:hypothetical protein